MNVHDPAIITAMPLCKYFIARQRSIVWLWGVHRPQTTPMSHCARFITPLAEGIFKYDYIRIRNAVRLPLESSAIALSPRYTNYEYSYLCGSRSTSWGWRIVACVQPAEKFFGVHFVYFRFANFWLVCDTNFRSLCGLTTNKITIRRLSTVVCRLSFVVCQVTN